MPKQTDRDHYTQALAGIQDGLASIELAIADLDQQLALYTSCDDLDEAAALPAGLLPMWPNPPARHALESRHRGEPNYLTIYWRQDSDGAFQGPARQRKLTIGCDPRARAQAVTLTANRERYDTLLRAREQLTQTFGYRLSQLDGLAQACQATALDAARACR
jgi:hypothetical protein